MDPLRRCMVLELYEGILTVLPIQQTPKYRKRGDPDVGSLLDPVPCRIAEMGVRGSGFLWPRTGKDGWVVKARLAVLFVNGADKVGVKVLEVETGVGQIAVKEESKWFGQCDAGAGWLIPVPEPACRWSLQVAYLWCWNEGWIGVLGGRDADSRYRRAYSPLRNTDNISRRHQSRKTRRATAEPYDILRLDTR